jgi:hypothetical protein
MFTNTEKPVAILLALALHRLVDVGLKGSSVFEPTVEIVEVHFLDLEEREAALRQSDQGQYSLAKIA